MTDLFLTTDLLFSSEVLAAASAQGLSLQTVSSTEQLLRRAADNPPRVVLVDLSLPGLDISQVVGQLRQLSAPPRAVVAYGPHVHTAKLEAAHRAGCDKVLSRGQLSRDMAEVLRELKQWSSGEHPSSTD